MAATSEDMSRSEGRALMQKALVGCGVADDAASTLARAVLWLEDRGVAGISFLASEFAPVAEPSGMETRAVEQAVGQHFSGLVCDLDMLVATGQPLSAPHGSPRQWLALGLAGTAAADLALSFRLVLGAEGQCHIVPDRDAHPGRMVGALTAQHAHVEMDGVAQALEQRATCRRLRLTAAQQACFEGCARRTLVPASDQSRLSGAGAGLNDND